jgi:TonB family protein
MVFTGIILVLSIDNAMAQKAPPPAPKAPVAPPAPPAPPDGQWTVLPDSIKSAEVIDKKGVCYIKYEMKDGRKFTYELNQAQKKGYYIPPPPPPPPSPKSPVSPESPVSNMPNVDQWNAAAGFNNNGKPPLFIYAGLEISEAQAKQIDPNRIASIDVLKGESAIKEFGEKGKNGVIKIKTKDPNVVVVQGYELKKTNEPPVASNGPGEVVVVGYGTKANASPANQGPIVVKGEKIPAMVLLDGKRIASSELNNISPDDIASVNVLKGENAVAKYGAEASDGAIEIVTKSYAAANDKLFVKTEQMPAFPGGSDSWRRHLERNLQYPNKAQENGTMGAVKVQFVVDTEGNISDVKAVNDPGDGLAEEAVRIIKTGPKWEPAVQNGHKVTARTFQTITFRLE